MEQKEINGLEGLDVWRQAIDLCSHVCKEILPTFPPEEKWCLSQQLRRSMQSIPANIAEGYGRYYFQETVRFCYVARGSLEESFSHILLAKQLGYIHAEVFKSLKQQIIILKRLLNGYIAYLKRKKTGMNEPGNLFSLKISENHIQYDLDDKNMFNPDLPTTNHQSHITNYETESERI